MVFKPQTFHEIPPQSELESPTDAVLESDVAAALARAGAIDASRVTVTAAVSHVTLEGYVGGDAELAAAKEVASAVKGVASVDNRLVVHQGTT